MSSDARTSDSSNINLPIKLFKSKLLIHSRISPKICSSQLSTVGYKFIYRDFKFWWKSHILLLNLKNTYSFSVFFPIVSANLHCFRSNLFNNTKIRNPSHVVKSNVHILLALEEMDSISLKL